MGCKPVSLLFHFAIESTDVFVSLCFRKMESEFTPIFMLLDRCFEKINQTMAIGYTKIGSFFVCTSLIATDNCL